MSSGSDVQKVDFGPAVSGFQNLAGTFNSYMAQAYDWAKGQWKKQEPYSDEVQQIMLDQARAGADWAQADRARYEQVFKPIEDQYIKEVQAYDTPGRRAQEAGRAAAAASQGAEQAADEAKRQLTTFGVKPTDVRFGTLDLGTRLTKASLATAAAEKARMDVEGRGLALRQGVVNLGGQYPGRAIANYGMSQAGGQGGVNVGLATDQTYGQLMGTAPQWGGLNVNALSGLTGALDAQQKANLAVNEANQSGAGGMGKLAGTLIGGAAGAYFGGPMGAMAGSSIGGSAGGSLPFAEGGVIDIAGAEGGMVPREMSPSGGAATDDVSAVIPGANGAPSQPAKIDAGEFIFPRRTTRYYGSKHLQGLIDKADQAMGLAPPKPTGGKSGGAPAQRGPSGASGAPSAGTPGVIPMDIPASDAPLSYQGGGEVDPALRGWAAVNDAALMPKERSWRDIGGDALRGMALGGAGGAASQPRSGLDYYNRYGGAPLPHANVEGPRFADGGVIDTRPFDPEGEGYDDETVRRQGLTPDSTGHGSTYGHGGIMLKGARHPTRHLSIVEDERLGYESYKAQDGRYYVRPKGHHGSAYADGGAVYRDVGALVPGALGVVDRTTPPPYETADWDGRTYVRPRHDPAELEYWHQRATPYERQRIDPRPGSDIPQPSVLPEPITEGKLPDEYLFKERYIGPSSPAYERPFKLSEFFRQQQSAREEGPRFPGREDVELSRRVEGNYDDPYRGWGERGAQMHVIPRRNIDVVQDQLELYRPAEAPYQRVQDTTADKVHQAQMATRRSALAALGWKPDIYNIRESGKRYSLLGAYSRAAKGRQESGYWDTADPATLVHESIHRGVEKLKQAGKVVTSSRAATAGKPYVGHDEEEALVRLLMEQRYGPQRTGRREKDEPKNAYELLRVLDSLAAEQVRQERPYGGPR